MGTKTTTTTTIATITNFYFVAITSDVKSVGGFK